MDEFKQLLVTAISLKLEKKFDELFGPIETDNNNSSNSF
jgi:hypothetical protein